MRNTIFTILVAGSLIFMGACEDKQNQPPPKEYDPQIDSIAAAPLPVISPDVADQSSDDLEVPGSQFRETRTPGPGTGMGPDMTPTTETGADELRDTRSSVDVSADPNGT